MSGNAQVTIAGGAKIDRGIELGLTIQALANIDAGVAKYLTAEVSGQASAVASVTMQIQAPINLFKEVGFAVRLQAIAELAAAVQVKLGLKLSDFMDLAAQDPQMQGLPLELLRVLLTEASIKGGVYAKAALTAQAYAQLVVTGSAIAQPPLKPGFNIIGGIGAGLKAGAGFRVFAGIEIEMFSSFVARSVDVLVDHACNGAKAGLPDAEPSVLALIDAARPIFKIAFRTAYELGEYIAKKNPAADAAGAQNVALRCTQVALEEGQRYLLRSLTNAAFEAIRIALRGWSAVTPRAQWNASLPARRALADHVRKLPAAPFEATAANETYWAEFVNRTTNVAAALLGPALDASTLRTLSVLWSAVQLAFVASRRVERAEASLNVIGQPPRQARAPFTGNLTGQQPPLIVNHIRASIPSTGSRPLKLEDIVDFLVADAVLDELRRMNPGADRFLSTMEGRLGTTANDVARTILRNIGSVVAGGGGQLDAAASLSAIADSLRSFMADQIHQKVAPVVREQLSAPDLRTYFDEVFLPTTDFTLDVVFGVVLDWTRRGADKDRLVEALSGVMMKLVGRSLVATADILMAAAQGQMQGLLLELADNVNAPGGIVQELSSRQTLPVPVSEIAELVADALRIGAEALGPLSEAQRTKIRSLMYAVIDPMPVGSDANFMQQLGSTTFIPAQESLEALAMELGAVGGERFLLFVQKLIELIGRKILAELAAVLEAAQRELKRWVEGAQRAIEDMQRAIGQLVAEIERLSREVAESFDDAAQALLGAIAPLAKRAGREAFKIKLADEVVDDALAVLTNNDVYRNIAPAGLKRTMRAMARSALEEALDNEVIDSVLDVVGELAEEIDSILDDVRELDPDRDLAEQVGNLLLNRISDAVYDNIGRNPHISVAFTIGAFGVTHRISLGRIDIPVEAIVDALRSAIRKLAAFEDAVRAAAGSLASAFQLERELVEADSRHAEVSAKRERLDRQRAALVAVPRGLRILSPVPGTVAAGSAKVRIEVQGLPMDAAVDDDSPTSISIFLNGRELEVSGFSLSEIKPPSAAGLTRDVSGTSILAGYDALADLELKPHGPARLNWRRPAKGTPRSGANKLASAVVTGPGRKSERFALTARDTSSLSAGGARAVTVAATSRPATTPAARTAVARTVTGIPALTSRTERRLGAALTATQVSKVTAQSSGGFLLSRVLLGADLEEGLNTLIVSITPPDGARVETSCAFFAEAPAAQPPPKPGQVRLPVVVPRKPGALAPQKPQGKFLLSPATERAKVVAAQRDAITKRHSAKLALLPKFPAKIVTKPGSPGRRTPGSPR